jgi:hypothetical protein
MDRDVADSSAFAVDPQGSLAGGEADVVDVEADDLADPRAGVERGSARAWSRGDGLAWTARR